MTKDEALRLALEYVELVPDDRYSAEHIDQDALITAIKAALEAKVEPVAWRTFDGEGGYDYRTYENNEDYANDWDKRNPKHKGWVEPLYTTPPQQKAKDESVAWKWHQAPVKTSWGDGMVVADLAIDKDNTVSIYCERDQTAKVEAMFTPPKQFAPLKPN